MISTSYNLGIGTKYHIYKMLERKDARLFDRSRGSIQVLDMGKELQARLDKIKSDMAFDTIIQGNTEDESRVPQHDHHHYTLGQRVFAWWVSRTYI